MTKRTTRYKLMRLMEQYGLTCAQIAELIGVKAQTVRAWKCGLRPTPEYALTIIKLMQR